MNRPIAALRAGAFALAAFALTTAAAPTNAAPTVHTIVIDKMKFAAPPKTLHAGDVVVWVNKDIFRHTATAKDKSFDVDLAPGASGRTVLRKAGAIPVLCRYHPGMTVRLSVAP